MGTTGTDKCGLSTHFEETVSGSITFAHYGQGVKFKFSSTLDETPNNEVR